MYASAAPLSQQPAAICALKSPADAIHILEAVRVGLVPRVTRRLTGQERGQIRPGTVWVWEEEETNMRRWTDGRRWGASRVGGGGFLVYTESSEAPSPPADGFATGSAPSSSPRREPLIKQTYSTSMTHPASGQVQKFHVVAYSSKRNPQGDAPNVPHPHPLPLPHQLPLLANLRVMPGIWPEWEQRPDLPRRVLAPHPSSAAAAAAAIGPGASASVPSLSTTAGAPFHPHALQRTSHSAPLPPGPPFVLPPPGPGAEYHTYQPVPYPPDPRLPNPHPQLPPPAPIPTYPLAPLHPPSRGSFGATEGERFHPYRGRPGSGYGSPTHSEHTGYSSPGASGSAGYDRRRSLGQPPVPLPSLPATATLPPSAPPAVPLPPNSLAPIYGQPYLPDMPGPALPPPHAYAHGGGREYWSGSDNTRGLPPLFHEMPHSGPAEWTRPKQPSPISDTNSLATPRDQYSQNHVQMPMRHPSFTQSLHGVSPPTSRLSTDTPAANANAIGPRGANANDNDNSRGVGAGPPPVGSAALDISSLISPAYKGGGPGPGPEAESQSSPGFAARHRSPRMGLAAMLAPESTIGGPHEMSAGYGSVSAADTGGSDAGPGLTLPPPPGLVGSGSGPGVGPPSGGAGGYDLPPLRVAVEGEGVRKSARGPGLG